MESHFVIVCLGQDILRKSLLILNVPEFPRECVALPGALAGKFEGAMTARGEIEAVSCEGVRAAETTRRTSDRARRRGREKTWMAHAMGREP